MIEHRIERTYTPNYTIGEWYDDNGIMICKTLELPWLDNKRDDPRTPENEASCIPEGVYTVTKEKPIPPDDPQGRRYRPYGHFRLHNVPGRSGILVHRITFVKDLKGCIGVGSKFSDINKDGVPDMLESSKTLESMYKSFPEVFKLRIEMKRV